MLIQCTKKLLDQIQVKPVTPAEEDPLFSWHANLLRLNYRKTIVLVNDKNRYIIVLHGLKAKDFKNIDELLINAIRETFQKEGIKPEVIEQFITHRRGITYTKTKNRSTVATMNKSCEIVGYFDELLNPDTITQTTIAMKASGYMVHMKNDFLIPRKEMYKDLEGFMGNPIFGCKAVQLKVTLALENHNVWRRLIVPADIPFDKFHDVLQIAFDWTNSHLHDFYIYGEETVDGNILFVNHCGYHKEGYKPKINLVFDEEALSYPNDVPMKLETGIKLSEYIPAKMKYNYDFGDRWQHYIEVEKIIDEYDKNHPVCLEGEGNSPPEDVGGESGYDDFLEALSDKSHPDHEWLSGWGRSQGYNEFDIAYINRKLANYHSFRFNAGYF